MEQKYELYHHGILGMKWGIRRFQNEDGSLTAAGRKRYGSDLYKKLSKDSNSNDDQLYNKYKDHALIKSIANDKDRLKALENLINTKYDGPKKEYDPWTDKKVVDQARKEFEHDMHRKFDPENRQDEKLLDYYISDVAEKTGANKKAEKLNKAPSWDKALDEYGKANKKAIEKALGSMSSLKLKTIHSISSDYADVVRSLIWRIDNKDLYNN